VVTLRDEWEPLEHVEKRPSSTEGFFNANPLMVQVATLYVYNHTVSEEIDPA
jgi:hypothetical protein